MATRIVEPTEEQLRRDRQRARRVGEATRARTAKVRAEFPESRSAGPRPSTSTTTANTPPPDKPTGGRIGNVIRSGKNLIPRRSPAPASGGAAPPASGTPQDPIINDRTVKPKRGLIRSAVRLGLPIVGAVGTAGAVSRAGSEEQREGGVNLGLDGAAGEIAKGTTGFARDVGEFETGGLAGRTGSGIARIAGDFFEDEDATGQMSFGPIQGQEDVAADAEQRELQEALGESARPVGLRSARVEGEDAKKLIRSGFDPFDEGAVRPGTGVLRNEATGDLTGVVSAPQDPSAVPAAAPTAAPAPSLRGRRIRNDSTGLASITAGLGLRARERSDAQSRSTAAQQQFDNAQQLFDNEQTIFDSNLKAAELQNTLKESGVNIEKQEADIFLQMRDDPRLLSLGANDLASGEDTIRAKGAALTIAEDIETNANSIWRAILPQILGGSGRGVIDTILNGDVSLPDALSGLSLSVDGDIVDADGQVIGSLAGQSPVTSQIVRRVVPVQGEEGLRGR